MEFEKNVFISLGTTSLVNQTKQKEKKWLIGIAVGNMFTTPHVSNIIYIQRKKINSRIRAYIV